MLVVDERQQRDRARARQRDQPRCALFVIAAFGQLALRLQAVFVIRTDDLHLVASEEHSGQSERPQARTDGRIEVDRDRALLDLPDEIDDRAQVGAPRRNTPVLRRGPPAPRRQRLDQLAQPLVVGRRQQERAAIGPHTQAHGRLLPGGVARGVSTECHPARLSGRTGI